MEDKYYHTASSREGYIGSSLHCFHILLEAHGAEWVANSSGYEYALAKDIIENKLSDKPKQRAPKFWTNADVAYLKANLGLKSYPQIAVEMGRTLSSIKQKVVALKAYEG